MMIKSLFALAALAAFSVPACAQNYVSGYTNSRGTTVEPYYRSSPNNTQYDNYSARGNVNPYTGEYGTRAPHY